MAIKKAPVKSGKPEAAEVKPCTCQNAGQDKLHGKGNRVFNQTAGGDYTCTVCGSRFKSDKKR